MSTGKFSKKFIGESRTKQSFKDECDLNHMLRTYQSGGRPPSVNPYPAIYGDFSQTPDYHSALNQVNEAKEAFMELPSSLRTRFDNDPGKLLAFVMDADNREEAEELGLVLPPEEPPIIAAPEPVAAPEGDPPPPTE